MISKLALHASVSCPVSQRSKDYMCEASSSTIHVVHRYVKAYQSSLPGDDETLLA